MIKEANDTLQEKVSNLGFQTRVIRNSFRISLTSMFVENEDHQVQW